MNVLKLAIGYVFKSYQCHKTLVCVFPLPVVYVICKLGNDSQKAVQVLKEMSGSEVDSITVKDICGGLMAWAKRIDPTFPQY